MIYTHVSVSIHSNYMYHNIYTFANWLASIPVASIKTLSVFISHQLEAVVTIIVSS